MEKIVELKWLPFKGKAFYPFIFIKNKQDVETYIHEAIHCRQQTELWVVFSYILYYIELVAKLVKYRSIKKAYLNLSFEREARDNQGDITYLIRREKFSWIKYL